MMKSRLKERFKISGSEDLETRLPFLKYINEVIVEEDHGKIVRVVDIQDGIVFDIERKFLKTSKQ